MHSMQPRRRTAARAVTAELQWGVWTFLGGFAVALALHFF
jgi:hypothetical protein